jgi:SAM-dependent methyltransferase
MSENVYRLHTLGALGERRKRAELSGLIDKLLPRLPEGARVIEAGAGRGEMADLLRQRRYDYLAIEPSQPLREALQRRSIPAVATPLPAIEAADASSDLVYSYDVLEHLPDYQAILKYFLEALRVLKPGGYLVTVAPNAEILGPLFFAYEYQHTYVTTPARVETMLGDAGFTVERSCTFLSSVGLSRNPFSRGLDRVAAHCLLLFARSPLVTGVMRWLLGRDFVFRVHKNLYDHFAIVARKPAE